MLNNKRPKSSDATRIRQGLSSRLGGPVNPDIWRKLEVAGWIANARLGLEGYEPHELAKQACKIAAHLNIDPTSAPPGQRRQKRQKHAKARRDALCMVLAIDARTRFGVDGFRARHTDGRALALDEIGSWLASTDSALRLWLEAPEDQKPPVPRFENRNDDIPVMRLWLKAPQDQKPPFPCFQDRESNIRWMRRWLAAPKDHKPRLPRVGARQFDALNMPPLGKPVPVVGAAMLELAHIARQIAKFYHFSEPDAVAVVLTDATPGQWLPYVQWTARNETIPALSTITLTVDLMTTPKEVAALYRKKRSELVQVQRAKPQGLKALRLAVFCAQHPGKDGAAMLEWNRRNPAHRYESLSRFNKESQEALNRLLGQPAVKPTFALLKA